MRDRARPLVTTAVVVAAICSLGASTLAAPEVGKPAPRFSLRDRDGALIGLADLAYPGAAKVRRPKQVVVLDFFRTDCKPCRKGLPKLVKLHERYGKKGVKVFLVALLEEEEGEAKLEAFLAKHPIPFPVLVDAYAVAGKKYVRNGNGFSLPALFVIDREGVLRGRFQGVSDKVLREKLQPTIEGLL